MRVTDRTETGADMTYEGSLEDEIRTAAAEAARDAETAERFRAMVTQEEADARSAAATRFAEENSEDEGHYLSSDVRRIRAENGRTLVTTKDGQTHSHPFGMVYVWEDLDSFRSALATRYPDSI